MKRVAGIFLIGAYLLSFAELHQFLKLPVLFEHFREHRQAEPGLSLFAYLKMHYALQLEKDGDFQRDQQLPFKDVDCCTLAAGSAYECTQPVVDMVPPQGPAREFHHFNENSEPQCSPVDIFQPPRCA